MNQVPGMIGPEERLSEDGKTFLFTFRTYKHLLLREDFDDLAHDAGLRAAHNKGLIPVGPAIIEKDEIPAPPPKEETLFERLNRQTMEAIGGPAAVTPRPQDLMRITVSFAVGSSIDLNLEEPTQPTATPATLEELLEHEMPDDLSELDGL